MDFNKKPTFKEKITKKFRIVIFNENSFEERFSIKVARLNIYILIMLFAILMITLNTLAFIYTPLKEYLPGISSNHLKTKTLLLSKQIDSLKKNLYQLGYFTSTLKPLLLGDVEGLKTPLPNIKPLTITENLEDNSIYSQESIAALEKEIQQKNTIIENLKREKKIDNDSEKTNDTITSYSDFRNKIESEGRFNIHNFEYSKISKMNFIAPTIGTITENFNPKEKHFAVDIAVEKKTAIKSIASGTVIFTQWTVDTGYIIMIMHSEGYVSIYKHNYLLNKKQGDLVDIGEVIGWVGSVDHFSTGPHLHFELWYKNHPLNPTEFINFEL